MLTEEEIQRAVEIGKRMGLEVSFGNNGSGVFIGDKKLADIHEMFPEMNSLEFTDEECKLHTQALSNISKIKRKRFGLEIE